MRRRAGVKDPGPAESRRKKQTFERSGPGTNRTHVRPNIWSPVFPSRITLVEIYRSDDPGTENFKNLVTPRFKTFRIADPILYMTPRGVQKIVQYFGPASAGSIFLPFFRPATRLLPSPGYRTTRRTHMARVHGTLPPHTAKGSSREILQARRTFCCRFAPRLSPALWLLCLLFLLIARLLLVQVVEFVSQRDFAGPTLEASGFDFLISNQTSLNAVLPGRQLFRSARPSPVRAFPYRVCVAMHES